jgi:hypothetical protein
VLPGNLGADSKWRLLCRLIKRTSYTSFVAYIVFCFLQFYSLHHSAPSLLTLGVWVTKVVMGSVVVVVFRFYYDVD